METASSSFFKRCRFSLFSHFVLSTIFQQNITRLSGSKIRIWIRAARPQTLPAAFVPVLVGGVLAWHDGMFHWLASSVALTCALLIQIGTNFANDYYDFVKGADTETRIGFERATATGLITSEQMKRATILTMAMAFFIGLYLVWHAGWIILLLGVSSLLFGVLYTGGPYPLAYNGLGDLFVFLYFGLVAVMGTYYVNALQWSADSFWAALAIGSLTVNILVVNNLRDIEQDRKAGKNTLGVIFGEHALRWEYLIMLIIAVAIPFYFYLELSYSLSIFLPLLSLPAAGYLLRIVWKEKKKERFNRVLERTAQFMVLYGMLFSAGIILS